MSTAAPQVLHRLTDAEYDHAVLDVFGLDLDAATSRRIGGMSSPFDNTSDGQTTADHTIAQYFDAAEDVVAVVLQRPPSTLRRAAASAGFASGGPYVSAEAGGATWWSFDEPVTQPWTVELPWAGTWTLTLSVTRSNTWFDVDTMPEEITSPELALHDAATGASAVLVVDQQDFVAPARLTLTVHADAGPHALDLVIDHVGYYGIAVEELVLVGVPDDPTLLRTPTIDLLLSCAPDPVEVRPCAAEILARVGRRLWRRPLLPDERARMADLVVDEVASGAAFVDALGAGLLALLVAPEFLYRLEIDPPSEEATRTLTPWELAARLSFFLWSSVPDDTLLDCAEQGLLTASHQGPCGLDAQVHRLLADARAARMMEGFMLQWLQVGGLADRAFDPVLQPDFDGALAASMLEETRRTAHELIDEEHPIRTWWDASHTWVDASLAHLYGLEAPAGEGFVRVELPAGELRGLLRQASVLASTSQPDRTSPVRRGAWLLGKLLCDPPPPPPGDVANQLSGEGADALAAHQRPECASCHATIDPWGLVLEGFDAIGRARTEDAHGDAIDTHVTLPEGEVFDGPRDLARHLADDDRVRTCVGDHLLTWALARRTREEDQPEVSRLHHAVGPDATLLDYAREITRSEPFTHRKVEVPS